MAPPPSRRKRGVRRADGAEDRIAELKDLADLMAEPSWMRQSEPPRNLRVALAWSDAFIDLCPWRLRARRNVVVEPDDRALG